jgi:hypothetical protein
VAKLRRGGCYRVETEISVRDKSDLTIDGQGAVQKRTKYTPPELRYPKANAVLRLIYRAGSVVENLKIRGTNTSPDLAYLPPNVDSYRQEVEFDHGLALHGLTRTVVENVRIRSVWGDTVYLAGGDQHTGQWSEPSPCAA